ncbi:MAG: protein arginine kinase [Firmicutes bacterium HGW-Firmicutes-7]|nr:MAG: protein arginine kinase [Firmicutes bacterium HGW-Firmicutes-7]
MIKWYEKDNENCKGVIISSRIRLARNLSQYPFPSSIDDRDAQQLVDDVNKAMFTANDYAIQLFEEIKMENVKQVDKIAMMERHVISPQFIGVKKPNTLILSHDESISIMVNEEDHIRIQSMQVGMNLLEALEHANKVDDLLEEKLNYAFDDKRGYLTACPTNLGTGLRASYMVHLPALETTGQLKFLLDAIGKFGLTVRGIYGEGSDAQGSIFQISNQLTLGINEQEIIDNLTTVTMQIVEQELIVRNKFLNERRLEFEDAIYRSYGILSNARVLTSKEAMTLLSDIKLGFELGILKNEEEKQINIFDLMTRIQPANLQKIEMKHLSLKERDIARATYIREKIVKLVK